METQNMTGADSSSWSKLQDFLVEKAPLIDDIAADMADHTPFGLLSEIGSVALVAAQAVFDMMCPGRSQAIIQQAKQDQLVA